MANPVLTRLVEERAGQVSFIDSLLSRVEAEGRDLVDAERSNLAAARERISEIDAQREPLEAFETLREISAESTRLAYAGRAAAGSDGGEQRQPLAHLNPRTPEYRSAGAYIVDYIRARGYPGMGVKPDPDAQSRVNTAAGRDVAGETRAIANNITTDIPGLLPKPIVGQIETDLDASRPFVTSIGVRPLTQPGKTFSRPTVTQHTQVGEQTTEKTELVSRVLKVGGVDFTKRTFGGAVDVARQVIDWSDPSAWDALLTDLQNEYGAETDDAAAQAFATAVIASVPAADGTVEALIDALYAAAEMIITGGTAVGARPSALRLPDTIWTSVDQWAAIGAALDKARLSLLTSPGAASPTSVSGDLLSIPRIMVPGFDDSTIIVGRRNRTEFYEERIGLLSAVEPKLLGVEIAYGGYAAFGTIDPTAFAKITAPVVP